MRSFHEIVVRAEDIARQEEQSGERALPKRPAPRNPKKRPIAERWARVSAAFDNAWRILEEEDVPRGPVLCHSCRQPIGPGEIRMFHGECVRARFEETLDLRKFKDFVRANYPEPHPLRELALALDDKVTEAEFPLLVQLVLRYSKAG